MKKFDIQRFAKRRIQVGDNLQGRIIYTDTFSKEEVEEFANECGDWQNYYIVSSTAGQYKNGIHEQMVPNEAENKIGSYKIDIAGQTIIQYDGTDITTQNNEISLVDYEYSILIDSIQRYNFNHEIVEDDGGKRYRKFYIEDAHVRPLVVGDEITTNTKFYFNIPDDIYSSLSGVTNPITLNGSDGFKINCIGNGSDQTLIRFSNAMGSTEEANIYDMISGTLNTNKSMMQNITTMDSSWVGIVEAADSTHPLYNMILVDETTLGNYIEPIERPINTRRVKIGDNLRNKKIYLDISNLDNSYFNNRWFQLAEVPRDIIKCGNISLLKEYPESNNSGYMQNFSLTLLDNTIILYKVGSDDSSSWSPIEGQLEYQMPDDKDYIITETIGYANDTEDYASLLCFYIEDNNIRPVQSGDVIDENTKTYINFPYKYSNEWSQEQSFNLIMNTEEEDNKIVMTFNYENNLLSIRDENTLPIYGTETNVNRDKSLPIGTVVGFSIEEVPYNANNYILVDTTTLGKIPTTSIGTISYKNGGNWNKLLSLAQEQIPLKGSIMPGPIKWSAVNSTAECTDSKTLYFVFGEEEASPTYDTVTYYEGVADGLSLIISPCNTANYSNQSVITAVENFNSFENYSLENVLNDLQVNMEQEIVTLQGTFIDVLNYEIIRNFEINITDGADTYLDSANDGIILDYNGYFSMILGDLIDGIVEDYLLMIVNPNTMDVYFYEFNQESFNPLTGECVIEFNQFPNRDFLGPYFLLKQKK